MDLSVILATYRRPGLLRQALTSFCALDRAGLDCEFVIVDNAGDRNTADVVATIADRLPLRFVVETAPGKNNALNSGTAMANGAICVFTDDDIVASPTWLIEMWQGAARWPGYDVFGGRVLPTWPDGTTPSVDHPFLRHAYAVADWEIPEGCYSAGYVFGPNMAIRASVFRAGWRFNPAIGPDASATYICGGETDLTRRLERAGRRAVFLPGATVFHQIRPEQLTWPWLWGRAFRKGRSDAYKQQVAGTPPAGASGGRSRSPLKTAARAYGSYLLSRVVGDRRRQLDAGLAYWHARGMLYQRKRGGC